MAPIAAVTAIAAKRLERMVNAKKHLLRYLFSLTDERLAENRYGQTKDPVAIAFEQRRERLLITSRSASDEIGRRSRQSVDIACC